ncbi:MAG: hypothetical protein KDB03_20805 [Planctomycetales bacterium]|nr:hypothetical protein [Planctomycetales bacterium]
MFRSHSCLLTILLASSFLFPAYGAEYPEVLQRNSIPAFPGAEGAGSWTAGGRGGRVLVVTQLGDSGPGSFREACEAEGPRIVVFGVAGIVQLESQVDIQNPFITIAGQTAPGDGICIAGETTAINTHDVIIRYVRFRRGNLKRRDDALGGNPIGNIMIDHVSASWGLDENMSMYRHMRPIPGQVDAKLATRNITIQWSISSEALDLNNHAFGGTWGGENCNFHHNLFACNTGRNPSIGMSGMFDFRNNVLFNWVHRTMDGGDGSSQVNVVGNYYKPGPATEGELRYRICRAQARNSRDKYPGFGKWYVTGNYVDSRPDITADNWAGGVQFDEAVQDKNEIIPAGTEEQTRWNEPFQAEPIRTQSAEQAFEFVMAQAGASLPHRDPVDLRVIESVRTGKVSYKKGIIEIPHDVGGYPAYVAEKSVVDTDQDGLPDDYEQQHRMNAKSASDAVADNDRDGYTNIEEYLNGTDPNQFIDYTDPQHNFNTLHQ